MSGFLKSHEVRYIGDRRRHSHVVGFSGKYTVWSLDNRMCIVLVPKTENVDFVMDSFERKKDDLAVTYEWEEYFTQSSGNFDPGIPV